MIAAIYVSLHVLCALSLFLFCYLQSKMKDTHYWKLAVFPIVMFTIVEGLRWGREIDWNLYFYTFNDFKYGMQDDFEPLFTLIWGLFAKSGLPYWSVISFSSFLFIVSTFYLFRPYKKYLPIAIPFFVFFSYVNAENLIRWYTGLSFVFFAVRNALDGKKVKALVFFICAVGCHYAMILLFLLYFLMRLPKPVMSFKAMVVVNMLLMIAFDPQVLGHLAGIFDYLVLLSARFSGYTADAKGWLTGASQASSIERRVPIVAIVMTIPLFIFAKCGDTEARRNPSIVPLYNLFVIGLFVKSMSSGLELFIRFSYFFEPFYGYFCALTFKQLRKRKNVQNVMLLLICSAYFIRKVLGFCWPFEIDQCMLFVWNDQITPNSMIKFLKMRS